MAAGLCRVTFTEGRGGAVLSTFTADNGLPPTAVEARITECLWAKTFCEANAGDIGYACLCHAEAAALHAFNPRIKLTFTKTLMQGHDCCNPRYVMEA